MKASYLYTLAGLLSFSMLGVFHKLADVKHCKPAAINVLLYVWSVVFALLLIGVVQQSPVVTPTSVISIAVPFGMAASVAILALQAGIRHGNIATSWLAINLSSGIPTIASILIYHEAVTTRKAFALLLIPISMALLWIDKKRETPQEESPNSQTSAEKVLP